MRPAWHFNIAARRKENFWTSRRNGIAYLMGNEILCGWEKELLDELFYKLHASRFATKDKAYRRGLPPASNNSQGFFLRLHGRRKGQARSIQKADWTIA